MCMLGECTRYRAVDASAIGRGAPWRSPSRALPYYLRAHLLHTYMCFSAVMAVYSPECGYYHHSTNEQLLSSCNIKTEETARILTASSSIARHTPAIIL